MADIDKLFYGAREKLQAAQDMFHELLKVLQNGNHGVDASELADCVKATAKAIQAADDIARGWQEKATDVQQPKAKGAPGGGQRVALNMGRDFDVAPLIAEKLYHDRPMTSGDVGKVSFDFDKFLPAEDE